MIELENFESHINGISDKEWKGLFSLLPIIKSTKVFGVLIEPKELEHGLLTFPYWKWEEIVEKTFDTIDQLQLTPIFDWMKWKEGSKILGTENFDFSGLDKITLCKLLTCIIRMERFSEGHLVSKFQDRTIEKILDALQNLIGKRK